MENSTVITGPTNRPPHNACPDDRKNARPLLIVKSNPPRKPPKSIERAKSGLVAYLMQNLMDIMVGVVSELSDGPELSNLRF